MRVVDPGHHYELERIDGGGYERLVFVKRRNLYNKDSYAGTNCQDVIRALIDRVQFLDNQEPHRNNPVIIKHLRLALTGFETRALEKRVEKGHIIPEEVPFSQIDGHWDLKE
jgi:hypothetical protein